MLLLALLALGSTVNDGTHAAARGPAQTARALVTAAQNHRPTGSYFTANATLAEGSRTWRGARAVNSWWQTQYRLGLHVSLISAISVRGDRAEAVMQRQSSGECAVMCRQRVVWRFSGSRIRSMTLSTMRTPKAPKPPGTVPKPPTGTPPRTTPTIPS